MKKHLKTVVAVVILAVTIAAFTYYLAHHPETVQQLKHLPPGTLLALLGLNVVSFGCLVLATRAGLLLYEKRLAPQENILFNAYSSLINFFGPGQSGVLFRTAYVKKRLNLGIKQYLFTGIVYYAFFIVINVLLMFAGVRPWWQTAVLVVAAAGVSFGGMRWYRRKKQVAPARLDPRHIAWIGGATLLQLLTQVVIYGLELHNIGAHAHIGQVLSYTGVANLAIFVALTPGAIGIRETFLLFSQHLHHIDSATIVAANVVDRGVYLVFLGLLFVLVVSLHAKAKLHVSQLKLDQQD